MNMYLSLSLFLTSSLPLVQQERTRTGHHHLHTSLRLSPSKALSRGGYRLPFGGLADSVGSGNRFLRRC
jgi:hypothetical protein